MSVPAPPQFEGMHAKRTFSFYPPILNVPNNEWLYRQATWSEVCVFNPAGNLEVWVPRRLLGDVSRVDEPMPIIGLIKELEYKAGTVVPHVRRVLEMPRAVNEGPRPVMDERGPAAEQPAPVLGIRTEPSEKRLGKMLLTTVAAAVLLVVVLVGLFRRSQTYVEYSTVMQSEIVFSARDDYAMVVARLGQPEDDRWQSDNGELQYRYLWYPKHNLRVVLMGVERKDARYIGELDKDWRVVHAVDDNLKQILRRLKRF